MAISDWNIHKGVIERNRYVLSHYHPELFNSFDQDHWFTCIRDKYGWICYTCKKAPPEEIAFVADLAHCEDFSKLGMGDRDLT